MKATYQHIWLWFLVAILMVPTAYAQGETVLGAYFMNGNTDVFSSRIYLRNPSDNPGDVTVRVFTLPPTSGTTQELTTGPLAREVGGQRWTDCLHWKILWKKRLRPDESGITPIT